jgi:TonB family protein
MTTESNGTTPTGSASKPAKAGPVASTKPFLPAEAEPAPMVVKGGKVPAEHKETPAADAPAPSLAGMTPGAAPPPDLVAPTSNTATPVLQTLSISQGVSQGLLYKKVAPTYPPTALRMRIEGAVELQATIAKTGEITNIKVLKGDPQLTKAASDAVRQWKYKPYLLNGEPVEIQTEITVNFRLPH